jgi:hypothetical protein
MAFYATVIPFRVVEDEHFRMLLYCLRPGFKVPSRHQLAGRLLDKVYRQRKEAVVELLSMQTHVTLVSDMWYDPNKQSIVNFVLVSLGMPSVFWSSLATGDASHTGVFMAQRIQSVAEQVESTVGCNLRVSTVVTDNSSNMIALWTELRKWRKKLMYNGCAAHAMNLLIKDVIRINLVGDARDKAVKISKFVRTRNILLDRFRQKQQALRTKNEGRHALSVPVPTRWYTYEKCIRGVLENQFVLKATFDDDELLRSYQTPKVQVKLDAVLAILNDNGFWAVAKIVLKLLKPINKSLANLEEDKTHVSAVVREFAKLKSNSTYATPMIDPGDELAPRLAEVQCEVLDLIKEREKFIVTSSMRVGFLLDHTTDIYDLRGPDLEQAMSDAIKIMQDGGADAKKLSKFEKELIEWISWKHLLADTNTAASTLNLPPVRFW